MRTLLILIFLFLIVSHTMAQRRAVKKQPVNEQIIEPQEDIGCFDRIPPEASFKGGHSKWIKFLARHARLDSIMNLYRIPVGCHTVLIRFIVDKHGKLSDFTYEAKDSVHPALVAEAIRLMELSPPWEPAMQSGCYVKSYRKQPFSFCIEEDEADSIADNARSIITTKLDSSLGDQYAWFATQLKKIPMELLLPDSVSLYNSKISVQFVLNNGIADSLMFIDTILPSGLKKELARLIQTPGIWEPYAGEGKGVLYEAVIDVVIDKRNMIL